MRVLIRTSAMALGVIASAAIAGIAAQAPTGATLCDRVAAAGRESQAVSTGKATIWSVVTNGVPPVVEIATKAELTLGHDPAPDERVQFEKRFRALYGNAEAVLKDLRDWEDFDIVTLPGSAIRLVLRTGGTAPCEARYFFRVTTSREVVRVPDPPDKTSSDVGNAICENLGGWGYLARIGGTEAFLEYHVVDRRESFRIVPWTGAGWQPACTFAADGK